LVESFESDYDSLDLCQKVREATRNSIVSACYSLEIEVILKRVILLKQRTIGYMGIL